MGFHLPVRSGRSGTFFGAAPGVGFRSSMELNAGKLDFELSCVCLPGGVEFRSFGVVLVRVSLFFEWFGGWGPAFRSFWGGFADFRSFGE